MGSSGDAGPLLPPLEGSLRGKVALVTGASSGIGRVFARYLVQQGCHVAAAARRTAQLQELQDEVESLRERQRGAAACPSCASGPPTAPGPNASTSPTAPASHSNESCGSSSKGCQRTQCCGREGEGALAPCCARSNNCPNGGSPCARASSCRGAPCGAPGCALGRLLTVELDVTGPEAAIDSAVGRIWDHFGGINVVVNNAGYRGSKAGVLDIDDADFVRTLATNVRGPWVVAKAVVRRIVAAKKAASSTLRTLPGAAASAPPHSPTSSTSNTTNTSNSSNSNNSSSCTSTSRSSNGPSTCSPGGSTSCSDAKCRAKCSCTACSSPPGTGPPRCPWHTPPDLEHPSVVNIASTAGLEGALLPNGAAYSSSKAAVIRLTKAMAIELGEYGVRCNAIAPGIFESDITQRLLQKEWMGRNAKVVVPLQRWGSTHPDLTAALHYFAAECSRHVTGSCLVVDGGHSLMRMRLDPRL